MTDETPATEPEQEGAAAGKPTPETGGSATPPRRPASPGAAAASRARRIGGRPVPAAATPRPADDRPTAGAAESAPEDSPGGDAVDVEATGAQAAEDPAALPGGASGDARALAVPKWLDWAPAGVLVVGAVVMSVLMVVFSHGVWWGPDPGAKPSAAKVNQVREQIMAAAKTCVVQANDYDYRDLDAYQKRALACTTGKLTTDLSNTIETQIKKYAPQLKAKQTTQISRGGIESVSPDGTQWTLLVFGQLSVVNANYPKGRTDPFGAEVRMEKVHGKWVMSDLTTVSTPLQG